MNKRKVLAFALLAMSGFVHSSSYATDELYLCGIVKNVDTTQKVAVIDVVSENCSGTRKFKLTAEGEPSLNDVDARKCFSIDSDTCKSGYIYTITNIDSE